MKKIAIIIGALLILASCGKEESSIQFTFSGVNTSLKTTQTNAVAEVDITDFRLSIRDVEFKLDESDLDSTEVQFRGPYDVDLMSETDALSQTIGEEPVEAGTYKVDFNANELVRGEYLYKLEATDYFETKKMSIIK